MWLGLQDQQTPSPVLLTTPPGSLRGPGALPQLAQRAFSVVATLRILSGFLLTYKLVSCFLSRDLIALVLPETKTWEAADLRGQQPCSPYLGPSGFGADLLPVPRFAPQSFRTPISPVIVAGPLLEVSPLSLVPTSLLWAYTNFPTSWPSSPLVWSLTLDPPLTLAFSYRTHLTPVLMFRESGITKPKQNPEILYLFLWGFFV